MTKSLLEKMFIKRFCLPNEADIISQFENGTKQVNSCLCGRYNHVSCVFTGNLSLTKGRILSYGVNTMGDSEGLNPGVHAEFDSIRKLKPLKKTKKLMIVNILVVRLSCKNKIQLSKPCMQCVQMMKTFPAKLGYKIGQIYYSNNDGEIIKSNITTLEKDKPHYSRFYRIKKEEIILV